MASVGNLEPFDIAQPERWLSYYARFELYLMANDVQEGERQKAIFLTLAGPSLFDLLTSLVAPKPVGELKLKEIKSTLTNHFSPKPSEIAAFYKFHKRDQQPNENFADYVAALRKLAVDCSFGTALDRMLRDRLVCGLRDEALPCSLLAESDLQLQKVIDRATTAEAATKNALEIRQPDHVQQIIRRNGKNYNQQSSHKPSTYRSSAAMKPCQGCGRKHARVKCPYLETVCSSCGIKGHLQCVCRSTSSSHNSNAHRQDSHKKSNSTQQKNTKKHSVNQILPLVDLKKSTTITINGRPCKFEVDSGSNYTIMSSSTFERVWAGANPKLYKCELQLVDFQGNRIPIKGIVDVQINYNGILVNDLPVVVADELGKCTGPPVSLQIDPSVQPIRLPPRRIPLSTRGLVEAEIERLISQGILEPTEYSEWATPIVPVPKSDGSIRICGDYKSTLNKALKPQCFQIPAVSVLLSSIEGGSVFAKLDLAQAYQQLVVDEKSAILQTIVTHKGIFQNFIENLLRNIPGVLPYFDDIVVMGKSEQELAHRLEQVFLRYDNAGLRLHKDKCKFNEITIEFLGFKLDSFGIRPAPGKLKAIQNAPPPSDKKQLQAFLGLLNFYHCFLPHKATIAEPLHRLLDKNCKWLWTSHHQEVFEQLKQLIVSDRVLVHYDEKLPPVLVCNASPFGVGAVLSHRMQDGSERPVAFYSRTLNKTERNYAQIDREAVAIIAGVKKFNDYLYGTRFTIVTDHRPLLGIFNSTKPIPAVISNQMLRRCIFLNAYDFEIIHRSGSRMGNADFLSRFPVDTYAKKDEEPSEVLMIEMTTHPVLDVKQVASLTAKDSDTSMVLSWALRGWPNTLTRENKLYPYFVRRTEISTLKGCLLWGNRVIVPPGGRQVILDALHASHPGIVRMKALARSYVWWPQTDADIERVSSFVHHAKLHATTTRKLLYTCGSRPKFHGHGYTLTSQALFRADNFSL
ncbi:PREDICTED: uncharacterized protein K02A2.6-like [Rhagoletis zephyria]|uniref:uncharacterized protein K02A2.6-like n=1 Tax=Rhagoletis zephyria TaxID=28612 RepID=UPI0008113227|nr:PREDICTED: uncharacterized protein K02A2.6-like [Rhagoletis zephyria]